MRSSTCANCAATNASRRERVWEDDDTQPKASDVQIGVLGLGVMGKDAVTKLKALGFKVAGWSAKPKVAARRRLLFGRGRARSACWRRPTCSSCCCR